MARSSGQTPLRLPISPKPLVFTPSALFVFLVGVALLSASFSLLGADRVGELVAPVAHPLAALGVGILATAVGQSSTVTVSIILGLAATGSLPLSVAVPMVMGANIGTSVTSTIVALGHLREAAEFRQAIEAATLHDFINLSAMAILLPVELAFRPLERAASTLTDAVVVAGDTTFTSPLALLVDPIVAATLAGLGEHPLAGILVAVGLLIVAIQLFAAALRPGGPRSSHRLRGVAFGSAPRGFLVGLGLTAVLQSSSVTTSLAVPFAGLDLIDLDEVFPYLIGANVGTTLGVLVAAVAVGSTLALTVAVVHVLFNLIGAAIIYPLRRIPLGLSVQFARGVSAPLR